MGVDFKKLLDDTEKRLDEFELLGYLENTSAPYPKEVTPVGIYRGELSSVMILTPMGVNLMPERRKKGCLFVESRQTEYAPINYFFDETLSVISQTGFDYRRDKLLALDRANVYVLKFEDKKFYRDLLMHKSSQSFTIARRYEFAIQSGDEDLILKSFLLCVITLMKTRPVFARKWCEDQLDTYPDQDLPTFDFIKDNLT